MSAEAIKFVLDTVTTTQMVVGISFGWILFNLDTWRIDVSSSLTGWSVRIVLTRESELFTKGVGR